MHVCSPKNNIHCLSQPIPRGPWYCHNCFSHIPQSWVHLALASLLRTGCLGHQKLQIRHSAAVRGSANTATQLTERTSFNAMSTEALHPLLGEYHLQQTGNQWELFSQLEAHTLGQEQGPTNVPATSYVADTVPHNELAALIASIVEEKMNRPFTQDRQDGGAENTQPSLSPNPQPSTLLAQPLQGHGQLVKQQLAERDHHPGSIPASFYSPPSFVFSFQLPGCLGSYPRHVSTPRLSTTISHQPSDEGHICRHHEWWVHGLCFSLTPVLPSHWYYQFPPYDGWSGFDYSHSLVLLTPKNHHHWEMAQSLCHLLCSYGFCFSLAHHEPDSISAACSGCGTKIPRDGVVCLQRRIQKACFSQPFCKVGGMRCPAIFRHLYWPP